MIVAGVSVVLGMAGLAGVAWLIKRAIQESGELPGSLTVRELSQEQLDLDRERMHVIRDGKD